MTDNLMEDDNIVELMEFVKVCMGLGSNVIDQVITVVNEIDTDKNVNSNAIKLAYNELRGWNYNLDKILSDYLEKCK